MKNTTIVAALLVLVMFFVACQKEPSAFSGGTRGKGEFSFFAEASEQASAYVLGTASRRIHRRGCPYAEKIKAENRLPCLDIRQAEAEGYTSCRHCLSDLPDTNVKEEEQTK